MKLTRAVSTVLTAGVMVAGLTACENTPVAGTPSSDAAATTSSVARSAAPTPAAGPASTTAPPVTGVPTAAWVNANRLPLNDSQHWPNLADSAQPLGSNAFQIDSLCAGTPTEAGGNGAASRLDRGDDNWSAQQVIVHYPGDPWTMGQTAHALFTTLQGTLTGCQSTSPTAQLAITTPKQFCPTMQRGGCNQVAAEIRLPDQHLTAHVYLAVVGSAVTELSVWSVGAPTDQWQASPDEDVFAAMNPQLCSVWEC